MWWYFIVFEVKKKLPMPIYKALVITKNLINSTGDMMRVNINSKVDLALLDSYKFDYIPRQVAISNTCVYD